MANCPKCGLEAGCPCSWQTASDGVKCCSTCFAANQTQHNSQQHVIQNNSIGIQLQPITYQHNYTG